MLREITAVNPSGCSDPLLGEKVCRSVGGNVLLILYLKDLQQCVIDLGGFHESSFLHITLELDRDIDQATGIDDIVGCVKDLLF